jgi:hypothetical protein
VSFAACVTESVPGAAAVPAADRWDRPSALLRIAAAPTAPAATNVAMTMATALPRSITRLNRCRAAARAA